MLLCLQMLNGNNCDSLITLEFNVIEEIVLTGIIFQSDLGNHEGSIELILAGGLPLFTLHRE